MSQLSAQFSVYLYTNTFRYFCFIFIVHIRRPSTIHPSIRSSMRPLNNDNGHFILSSFFALPALHIHFVILRQICLNANLMPICICEFDKCCSVSVNCACASTSPSILMAHTHRQSYRLGWHTHRHTPTQSVNANKILWEQIIRKALSHGKRTKGVWNDDDDDDEDDDKDDNWCWLLVVAAIIERTKHATKSIKALDQSAIRSVMKRKWFWNNSRAIAQWIHSINSNISFIRKKEEKNRFVAVAATEIYRYRVSSSEVKNHWRQENIFF